MEIIYQNSYHSLVFEHPLPTGEKQFIQVHAVLERINCTREELYEMMRAKNVAITTIFGFGDYISDIDYKAIITRPSKTERGQK